MFGAPALLIDGQAASLSERALAYLVYLRLGDCERKSAVDVARLIWGNKANDSLRDSVYQVRAEIRAAAPPLLRDHGRKQRLDAEVECDADLLARHDLPAEERLQVMEAAARGFMADFDTPPGAERFAEWVRERRAAYDRQLAAAVQTEAGVADDDPAVLERLGRIGLLRDPLDADAATLRVRALVRGGRVEDAKRQLREFVTANPAARSELTKALNEARSAFAAPAAEPVREDAAAAPAAPIPVEASAAAGDETGLSSSAETGDGARVDDEGDGAPGESGAGASPEAGDAQAARARVRRRTVALAALVLVAAAGIGALSARGMRRPACGAGEVRAEAIHQDYQPGSAVEPGQPFTKSWRIRNTGRCTWPASTYLRFGATRKDGVAWSEPLSRSQAQIRLGAPVQPGAERAVAIPMQAPTQPGSYEEEWMLQGAGPEAEGTRAATASIVVLPDRIARCAPGGAADTMVVSSVVPARRMEPGSTQELSFTFRNAGDCTWAPGSRLELALPPEVARADSLPARAGEEIRPRQRYTYSARVRLPAVPGEYGISAVLRDSAGRPVAGIGGAGQATLRVGGPAPRVPAACPPGELGVRFVSETVVDNTVLRPGTPFVKEWTVMNTSSRPCAWLPGMVLRRASGDPLGAVNSVRVDRTVLPGEVVTLRVPMRAPAAPGVHREDWELRDWRGTPVKVSQASTVWALVVVAGT